MASYKSYVRSSEDTKAMRAIEKYTDMDIQVGDYLVKTSVGDGDTDIVFLYRVLSKKGDRITVGKGGARPMGLKFYDDRTVANIPEYKGCYRQKSKNLWFFRYITAADFHKVSDDFQICY